MVVVSEPMHPDDHNVLVRIAKALERLADAGEALVNLSATPADEPAQTVPVTTVAELVSQVLGGNRGCDHSGCTRTATAVVGGVGDLHACCQEHRHG